jgi:DNA-binding HxlR family transcriptional regulator
MLGHTDSPWKIVILYKLLEGALRFNEIRRLTSAVPQRMSTYCLCEQEAEGLVARSVHAEVPPRVGFSLSALGRSLEPVLMALETCGGMNLSPSEAEAA